MKRLLACLGVVAAGVAHGADGAFAAGLRTEFDRIAKDFGATARLVVDEQGKDSRSERDGTVVIGLAAIQNRDLATRLTSAAFYLAHELWHVRQYQLYGYDAVKSNLENQRLYECQADLMGVEQLIRTGAIPLAPKQLQSITDLAYSLGAPAHSQTDHPTPEQRRTAVKYGVAFGATDARLLPVWQKEFGDRAQDAIGLLKSQIGFRDGMTVDAWSLHQCKLVTHYNAEALSAIATEAAVVQFNKDPNAPFVFYKVPYRNISSRPVRLMVVIQSTMVWRKDPNDFARRVSYAVQQYEVDIAPSETYEVSGTLPWYGDSEDYYPALEFKTNGLRSLVAAEFIGDETERITCLGAAVEAKTPLAKALSQVLAKLAPTSDSAFKPFRAGAATQISDSAYYQSTVQLPEATETEVEIEKEGAARVNATIYGGKAEHDAMRAYKRYRDAILEICPVGIKYKELNGKYGPDLTLPFSRRTQVNLYVHGTPEKGYRTYFILAATKW